MGGLGSVLTAVLPHIPAKVLGLIQLSLLARLLKQSRSRTTLPNGANGIDDDRDGFIDEEDELTAPSESKSNVMIFLGKHNIQVSNHGVKKDGTEDCVDGCEDAVEDNGEEDEGEEYVDENQEEEEEEVDDNSNGKDYAYKYKKFKGYGIQKKKLNVEKKKKKNSVVVDETKGEEEGDPDYYTDQKPVLLSYATSNPKPALIQPMVPWNKKTMAPIGSSSVQSSGETTVEEQNPTQDNTKDANLMAVSNRFPIKSPQSYTLKRSSESDKRRSLEAKRDDHWNDWQNYQFSDNEINELLSHPKVIEILRKLNESLFEAHEEEKEEKKTKRRVKTKRKRIKRQVINNEKQWFADKEWWPIRLKRLRQPLVSTSSHPESQSLPNYSIHSSSQLQKSQIIESDQSINDYNTESSGMSIEYETDGRPESTESKQSETKTNPSDHKSSSSITIPLYHPMAVTDDDTYPMQLERPIHGQVGYVGHIPFPTVIPPHLVGIGHDMAYGGDVKLIGSSPKLPIIDLTYWNKANKKKKKKKKKKSKKKYSVTTEAPEYEEDYENEYEDNEDDYQEVPVKKSHTTVQVIKSGTVKGNIGYGFGSESKTVPDWVVRMSGTQGIFGKG